jgi:hypothetical protein
MDTGSIEFQQFDLFGIFAGTEDDAEWQVLFGFLLVLSQPAEIELIWPLYSGLKLPCFSSTTTDRLSVRL